MRGTTAPRLHLELMCARVLLPGADVNDRGIHARLDRLERRLGVVGAATSAEARPAATNPQPCANEPRAGRRVGFDKLSTRAFDNTRPGAFDNTRPRDFDQPSPCGGSAANEPRGPANQA